LNTDSLNKWLTLIANLGVVIGLIFLGLEIRHNTQATIASASEGVTNQSLEYMALGIDTQIVAQALYKRVSGGELSGLEEDQLRRHQYYNFRGFQNVYLQYRRGFLDEDEWDVYRRVIASRLVNDPYARKMWTDSTGSWNTYFQSEVDLLFESPPDDITKGFN
jgi:hypothetical protein